MEALRAGQLNTLLQGQEDEEIESQYRDVMRKNELDITEIEHLKFKKGNNAKDILN